MKKIVFLAVAASAMSLAACDSDKPVTTTNSTTQVLDNGTQVVSNSTTTHRDD